MAINPFVGLAALALIAVAIWLMTPVQTLTTAGLFNTLAVTGYGDCTVTRVPYDCTGGVQCQEQCNGFNLLGVCIGSVTKTNCQSVQTCQYKTESNCNNPYAYNTNPSSSSSTTCSNGQVYMNGKCQSVYGQYTPVVVKTTVSYSDRLVCGGDVIANKNIQGFRYIQVQHIKTTCVGSSCSDSVESTTNQRDCVNQENYKVCRDDGGTPHCVFYPPEVKVYAIIDAVKNLFSIKSI